jgi:regulatory protein
MPHRITALKAQKRNPQRVNVYLDGEFAFGLARITAAWLSVGQEIGDEKIAELQAQDTSEVAYQQAARLLQRRQRSGAEIRRNLETHHFSEEVITGVLERLTENGLINDLRFAQDWVDNRNEFRPRSRKALAAELRLKGLSREAIQQALNGLDEEALAYQVALKHSRKLQGAAWAEFRQKLAGFLTRRGFDYAVAAQAARRVWEENQAAISEE